MKKELIKKWKYPQLLVLTKGEAKKLHKKNIRKERKEKTIMKTRKQNNKKVLEKQELVFSRPIKKEKKSNRGFWAFALSSITAIIAVIIVLLVFVNKSKDLEKTLNDYQPKTITEYVEVPVEKIVEVEKKVPVERTIYIVDEETLARMAEEKAQKLLEQYKASLEPETITIEVEKEVEVIKEVPVEVIKEIEVVKEVPVEVEVEKIVEKPVEVIKEVIVEKEVQVEVPVEVERIVEKPVEVIKEVEVVKEVEVEKPVYYIDEEGSEARAQELFEQYKQEWEATHAPAEEPAAATEEQHSTIRVLVQYKNSIQEKFYLEIEGKVGDELTWSTIKEALDNDERFDKNMYSIERIQNKNAVEVFTEEDFDSTRVIRLYFK